MKIYTTRFSFVLFFASILVQLIIGYVGISFVSNQAEELLRLQASEINRKNATATFVAENPTTLTPVPTNTPKPPTATPVSCLTNVSQKDARIYQYPTKGFTSGAVEIAKGGTITLIGKLENEPWWRVYFPATTKIGWIEESAINTHNCDDIEELDLSMILTDVEAFKTLVRDTFNDINYDWWDVNGNPIERPLNNGVAQLHLEDRSSGNNSEEIAQLENTAIPMPINFIVSVNPFSFYNNSYIGFRYRSATDPKSNWIEFRLIRKYCTVEWRYSMKGEITINPQFTLGEAAGCNNDKVSDYLSLQATYNSETDALRLSGNFNDMFIPSLTIFDREKIFQIGSIELIVSKSDVLFDYILIYQPK